ACMEVQRQRRQGAQPQRAETAAAVEQRGPHDAEVAAGGDDRLLAGQLAGEETAAVRMPKSQRRHVQVAQALLAAGGGEQRRRALMDGAVALATPALAQDADTVEHGVEARQQRQRILRALQALESAA